ncbi:MAG: hypothetical protein BWK80_20065 [Desulfobacteraceae bacterium IS3]|nr:MAG: hypothetical protein BWK80_20065 [Desulfobacteraceae bacterium IS3]HAO23444.1 hypothetical protein [Desulfobacteraceae bacterium]
MPFISLSEPLIIMISPDSHEKNQRNHNNQHNQRFKYPSILIQLLMPRNKFQGYKLKQAKAS